MKGFSLQKVLSHGVLRTFSLGIILCGITPAVHASNILRGSDYLATPDDGHTSFNFPQIGIVTFKGVPLPGLQGADTIIQRLSDAMFDINNDGFLEKTEATIPIKMTALSLVSSAPVSIQGDLFEVKPQLNSKPSAGTMTIKHNAVRDPRGRLAFNDSGTSQGTFTSLFDVNFDAIFTSLSNGQSFVIPDQQISLINLGANWSHTPTSPDTFLMRGLVGDQKANCHTLTGACHPGDFFPGPGPVNHAKGNPNYPDGHGTTIAKIIKSGGQECTLTVSALAAASSPSLTNLSSESSISQAVSKPICTREMVMTVETTVQNFEGSLQQIEGSLQQTPAPLPIVGAAAALRFCRTLRKRAIASRR